MQVILESITPNAEKLIERAARTCYQSMSKMTPDSTEHLIKKVIKNGHHSVLEHASATFRIKGCSRVMTHELVRHRLMSVSQESQRYVKYVGYLRYVTPDTIKNLYKIKLDKNYWTAIPENSLNKYLQEYDNFMEQCRLYYENLLKLGVPPEDARYVLPNAVCSEIVITANFRELRHIIQLRTSNRAHWEIREVANEILAIMKEKSPIVFRDLL